MDIQPGSTAAVIGCGYMGLGVIALMKLRGVSRIIAVDIRQSSLGIAAKLGADEVYTQDTVPNVYILEVEGQSICIRCIGCCGSYRKGSRS